MNLNDILTCINSGEINKLKSAMEAASLAKFINDCFDNLGVSIETDIHKKDYHEFNSELHDIHNKSKRLDKTIYDKDERPIKTVPVARLSMPEQQRIVMMAAAFLGSPELESNPATDIDKSLLEAIKKISDENKLEYKFKQIVTKTKSERECAELWYPQEVDKEFWKDTLMKDVPYSFRMKILSPFLGDTLLPAFDEYGDMVAFGRYYEVLNRIDNKKVCRFDIYTKDRLYNMEKSGNDVEWTHLYDPRDYTAADGSLYKLKGIPNVLGKIPVSYYWQPTTDWAAVQSLIERLEKKLSNLADTNDYYDSPIAVASGKVIGMSEKETSGKMIELENQATLTYLTWDNAPESMKLEITTLMENISKYAHCPAITFEAMKGIGNVAGVALKLLFMDAHLKASHDEELFGEGVQRRINFLKAAIIKLNPQLSSAKNLSITPKFTYYLPKDEAGEVALLVSAVQAGIMSIESAVKLNPLVKDYENELVLIKKEKAASKANVLPESKTPQ